MAKKKARKRAASAPPATGAPSRARARKGRKRAPGRSGSKKTSPPDWAPGWLEEFRQSRNVTQACGAVRIDRKTAYRRRDVDVEFREQWDAIVLERNDEFRSVLWERVLKGDKKPIVVHEFIEVPGPNGRTVYKRQTRVLHVTEYSTALQKFMAERVLGEEFAVKQSNPEDDRARAARACALLEEMRNSVPEYSEEADGQ